MSERPSCDLRSIVIPVIDVLCGQAVLAVRGRRSEYRPLESLLVRGSDPVDLAKALVERFGFAEIYVADLEALQGGTPQFDVLRRIAKLPVQILVDAGLGRPEQVERAKQALVSSNLAFVFATESSPDAESFRDCLAAFQGASRAALGLDYLRGTFRTHRRQTGNGLEEDGLGPEPWIRAASQAGVESVVALDLDRVGSDRGFAWPEGLASSTSFAAFRRKIGGGGIRSIEDCIAARAAGCDAVLVGSALHDGRIDAALVSDRG